jgi:N-acetylmuramoyl-L-alanine amidase
MLPTSSRLFILLLAACAALALFSPQARAQSRTIVIDPGHGGFDRGGVPGQRISEKEMALDVSLRLRRILQASGYRVVMTRESDVFIPLGTRVAIANANRGATFVSVHFNSARRSGANGIETYYYRGDSGGLAANIHRHVVGATNTENRGIRRRGFYVVRRTSVPSVLVELGFLTNPYEGRQALNPAYRQRLAEAVARGIRRVPAPPTRPVVRGAARSVDVLSPTISGSDVVQAAPRAARRGSVRYYKSSRSQRASLRGKASVRAKRSGTSGKKRSSTSNTRRKKRSSR